MSIDERLDHLNVLLIAAKKQMRDIQVAAKKQVSDLEARVSALESANKANRPSTSSDSDSSVDIEEVTPPRPKRRRRVVNYIESCDSESEDEGGLPKRPSLEPEEEVVFPVGSIFDTVDGYCVYLGDEEWGWFYRQSDLPSKQQGKVNKGDLIVSDYDYFNLDYNNKTVKRLVGSDYDDVLSRIRKDVVYLADSERIIELPVASDPEGIAPALQALNCQVHFGPVIKNKAKSDAVVAGLSKCTTTFRKCRHAYRGKCSACNMSPKWISHEVEIDNTKHFVGETCKTRIDILDGLFKSWHRGAYHVYLFRFMDSM